MLPGADVANTGDCRTSTELSESLPQESFFCRTEPDSCTAAFGAAVPRPWPIWDRSQFTEPKPLRLHCDYQLNVVSNQSSDVVRNLRKRSLHVSHSISARLCAAAWARSVGASGMARAAEAMAKLILKVYEKLPRTRAYLSHADGLAASRPRRAATDAGGTRRPRATRAPAALSASPPWSVPWRRSAAEGALPLAS